MAKLDTKLTQNIQDWLNTPADQRDIANGAMMMLSLNRNRALFNTIMRSPQKYAGKLEYELRKHLKIRLNGMAISDVVRMEQEVVPIVEKTIEVVPVLSTDEELPEGKIAKGKRADHDQLPEAIQKLWDENFDRYTQIVLLFNELKAMSGAEPCDRYEKLKILADVDSAYRAALAQYDSYVATQSASETTNETASKENEDSFDSEGDDEDASEDNSDEDSARLINAARKTISKYKKQIATLEDEEKRAIAIAKIQSCVNVVLGNGGTFTDATKNELEAYGIEFPVEEAGAEETQDAQN